MSDEEILLSHAKQRCIDDVISTSPPDDGKMCVCVSVCLSVCLSGVLARSPTSG